MSIERKIGKIKSIRLCIGGYDDGMFGFSFDLVGNKEAWRVGEMVKDQITPNGQRKKE